MMWAKALAVVAVATATAALPACTRVVDDARAVAGERPTTPVADESACTSVDAPLVTVPTDAGEPVLKLPQPTGWERMTEMDSDMVRYTLRNPSLSSSAVVTFESVAGTGDPEEALDGVRTGMMDVLGPGADVDAERHLQCGLTAETIDYVNPGFGQSGPLPATALSVVMMHDGTTYIASVNVLTKTPENPTYARDAEAIITGFQMLPPAPN